MKVKLIDTLRNKFYLLQKNKFYKPEYYYRLLGSNINGTEMKVLFESKDIVEVKNVLELIKMKRNFEYFSIQEQVVFIGMFNEISRVNVEPIRYKDLPPELKKIADSATKHLKSLGYGIDEENIKVK